MIISCAYIICLLLLLKVQGGEGKTDYSRLLEITGTGGILLLGGQISAASLVRRGLIDFSLFHPLGKP